jgi:hypothetical protein
MRHEFKDPEKYYPEKKILTDTANAKMLDECMVKDGKSGHSSFTKVSTEQSSVQGAFQRTGLLPDLLLSQANRIDTNNDNRISRAELKQASLNPDLNAETRIAAQYGQQNFDAIRSSGSWLSRQLHSSDTITRAELQQYVARGRNQV